MLVVFVLFLLAVVVDTLVVEIVEEILLAFVRAVLEVYYIATNKI